MKDDIIKVPGRVFVTHVKALKGQRLHLTFENGEERILDMTPYIFGVFSRLEEPDYFKGVRVIRGSISWPDGQDLAHDMLYQESSPVDIIENV